MKLSKEGLFRRSIHSALAMGACSAMSFIGTASAQEKPKDDKATELETVEVTGSRLPQPNLTSSSSYTIINDQELTFQGTINIEGMLNKMPQVFAEFSTGDSNGATGTATVNLRGLGSNRTLVLIDSKRVGPGDPGVDAPDLNFIPSALVDTVEILSGGASAVYGSDALAGVVNFKMKRDFDGFRLDSEGTQTGDGDGTTRNATAIWGSNFAHGGGNVTMYASYISSDAITEDRRDVSTCSLTTPASGATHRCQGSLTIPNGRFYSYDLGTFVQVDPAGTRTLVADNLSNRFNFAPYNYFQRPQERYELGGFGHREINEHFDVYADAMYMDDRTVAQIAPSGLFGTRVLIPCNSPLMSAQEQGVLCPGGGAGNNTPGFADVGILKRMTEVGPRQDDRRHTDNRVVIGTRGTIEGPWKYDVSYQRGEVVLTEAYLNDVSVTRANDALTGCASGDARCVPLDIFQVGAITPAMADYVRGIGEQNAQEVETVFTGSVLADLGAYGMRLPTSNSGLGLAVGVEHRRESLHFRPDFEFQNGDLAGQGGDTQPVNGEFSLDEVFGELGIPVVEDAPGFHLVQLDTAVRHSKYALTDDTSDTYKVGLQWMPTADVTVRASKQRAVRAPSVNEYFGPSSFGLFSFSDPCAGTNLTAAGAAAPTQAQCANTGVTAAQYTGKTIQDCSAGQCNARFSGNLRLKPEDSDTKAFGIVFQPASMKDVSLTVDYFDITVDGAIASAPTVAFSQCLLTGDPGYCNLIHRSANGRIWGAGPSVATGAYVDALLLNTSTFKTKGEDVEGNYKLGIKNWGSVGFNYVATFLNSYEAELGAGSGVYDCAGLYGTTCGTPNPKYRHKFRTTWTAPAGLAISANWRYFDKVSLDTATSDKNLTSAAGRANTIDRELKAKNYLDLSGTYLLPFQGEKITLRFGINNVFDVSPQGVSSNAPNVISGPPFGNGNTFPNVYDISQVYFLGLQADF